MKKTDSIKVRVGILGNCVACSLYYWWTWEN